MINGVEETIKKVKVKLIQMTLLRVETTFFEAKFVLRLTWCQEKRGHNGISDSILKSKDHWNPAIRVINSFGALTTYSFLEVDVSSNMQPNFIETKFFHGKFFNKLSLEHFPFDVQIITLMLRSQWKSTEVELVFDKKFKIAKGEYQAIKHQGLVLKDVYETTKVLEGEVTCPDDADKAIKMSLFLSRQLLKPCFMSLAMFLLSLLSLSTLCLDPMLLQPARVQLSLFASWSIFLTNFSTFSFSSPSLFNRQNKHHLMVFYTSLTVTFVNSFGHSFLTCFRFSDQHHLSLDSYTLLLLTPALLFSLAYFVFISSSKLGRCSSSGSAVASDYNLGTSALYRIFKNMNPEF